MSESTTVFVVRVWRAVKAFRASARAVEHEEAEVFTTPGALLRFLQREVPEAGKPAAFPKRGKPDS